MSNNYIITDSKEAMLNQLQTRLEKDEDELGKTDFYKTDAEQCRQLIGKLNPKFAKEQAMDTAIDSMKDEIGDLKNEMKKILKLLTDKNN